MTDGYVVMHEMHPSIADANVNTLRVLNSVISLCGLKYNEIWPYISRGEIVDCDACVLLRLTCEE